METWFAIGIIVCLVLFLDNISKGKQIEQMKNGLETQQVKQGKKPVQAHPQQPQNQDVADVRKLVLSLASEVRSMQQRQQIPPPPPQMIQQPQARQPYQSDGYQGRPPHINNHPPRHDAAGERSYH